MTSQTSNSQITPRSHITYEELIPEEVSTKIELILYFTHRKFYEDNNVFIKDVRNLIIYMIYFLKFEYYYNLLDWTIRSNQLEEKFFDRFQVDLIKYIKENDLNPMDPTNSHRNTLSLIWCSPITREDTLKIVVLLGIEIQRWDRELKKSFFNDDRTLKLEGIK